jgi:polyhydroxyalkanoate synthesis repressor PhaR
MYHLSLFSFQLQFCNARLIIQTETNLKVEIMPVIKRYANRKLYDTENKKYITLDVLAELIRAEEDVRVVDNVSGEDLTTVTLTQIIMEQEKKAGDFLPRSVLAALIQAGGESLSTLREKLTSPLDLLREVDSQIDGRIQNLIDRGEVAEDAGKKLKDQLLEQSQLWGSAIWWTEDEIQEALDLRGIPTRDEFQKLTEQIEALSAMLDDF